MRQTPRLLGLLALGSICQPLLATDHAHKQLDAHLHGAAELNIVVEQDQVAIELIAPADNFLGFEHQAVSAADKLKLEQTLNVLEKGSWIQLTESAGCTLDSRSVHSGLIEDGDEHRDEHASEHHDEEHHDEEHDDEQHEEHASEHHDEEHDDEHHNEHASEHHDEEHDEDGGEHHDEHSGEAVHNEFEISYQYRCSSPEALVGAELHLWQHFGGFERVQGQLISPQGQQRLDLTQDNPHIRF